MNGQDYVDPCDGCVFRYCVSSDFLNRCLKCKRIYKEDTGAHSRYEDLYKKKEDWQ